MDKSPIHSQMDEYQNNPLMMDDDEAGGGGDDDGFMGNYSLPRPPSPGGLQRTFTPTTPGAYAACPPSTDKYSHHTQHHLQHPPYTQHAPLPPLGGGGGLTSPSPKPSSSSSSSSSFSMGPPPLPLRWTDGNTKTRRDGGGMGDITSSCDRSSGSGGRELKRGHAFNGSFMMDDSPNDITTFPPPTPYKGTVYEGAPSGGMCDSSVYQRGSLSGGKNHHQLQQQQMIMPPISRFQNDFEVLGTIGSGSFGEVYRVRSRVDGMEYAVKCTRHRFKGIAHRDQYLQEVKALAKICNSDSEEVMHVVRYHQAWIENERLYMQTELCETSLDKWLSVGLMMSYDEVFSFLRQMLLALDVLHRNGLVHLDIKPANIFIKSNHYKLGDFGLVASVGNGGMGDCLVEGDSRYMSPELLQDGPKDLTKCDIFSLGVTVYEICRGQPFPPNGPEWHAIRSGNPPMIGSVPPNDDLVLILGKLMMPDPLLRPSAAYLLSHHRLKSKMERRLDHLQQQLAKQEQEKQKHRKLARTSTC